MDLPKWKKECYPETDRLLNVIGRIGNAYNAMSDANQH